jgi:hypothetical protein
VLIEDDFNLAQSYGLARHRLHNRLLHTWGIARGLTLNATTGAARGTVTAGEAIDSQGREIVLAADAQTPEVTALPGKTVFVTLAYRESETDPRTARGVTGNTRLTENPLIALSEAVPANPGDTLVLGRLVVGADGKIASRDDGVDPNRRRLAGAFVRGGAIMGSIAIGVDAPGLDYQYEYETVGIANPGHNLRLQSPNAILMHSGPTRALQVSVRENGFVGIGTSTPNARLHVQGGSWDLANSEGDIKLGDSTNRLKIGIALAGGGAGIAAIRIFGTWGGSGALTIGVGNNNNLFMTGTRVEVNGDLQVNGRLIAPNKTGFVVDQFFNDLSETLEQGDVVVIRGNQAGLSYGERDVVPIPEVDLAAADYDSRVCGIVAELRGVVDGGAARTLSVNELAARDRTLVAPRQIGAMVTLGAFGYCKVDADIAPIAAGDLLTTSSTRGHAQKVLDRERATGAILGKALRSVAAGKATIPVFVMLQ